MVFERLSYDFDETELSASGMSVERYQRGLEASKFMTRIAIVGNDLSNNEGHSATVLNRLAVSETVIKTRRKVLKLQEAIRVAQTNPKNDGMRTPLVVDIDVDSFDELYHHRSGGEPIRQVLVERGYDPGEVSEISWSDASSINGWHRLHDSHQAHMPKHVPQDLRRIDYSVNRAGINPAETSQQLDAVS